MGLDIYLEPAAQYEAEQKYEADWEALYARKESGEIDQKEYDRLRDELTGPGSRWTDEAKAETKSRKYPEHMCDRRYLRSSYNEGGFNRVVPKALGREDGGFYWIYEPLGRHWDGDDEGAFTEADIPAWEQCRDRALSVAEDLRNADRLTVTTLDAVPMLGQADHMWKSVPSDIDALIWFREEQNRRAAGDGSFSSYSCARGDVFGDGLLVKAAVPGVDFMGRPALHLIYEKTEEGADYYVQLAEIAAELCDEAIDLIKRDGKVYFRWSG